MHKTNHYTIPFFIPLSGCPHKCIFCDQHKITGKQTVLPEDIENKVNHYLSTIPKDNSHIEIGFFGGTFTGLPIEQQEKFLKPCQKFIKSKKIKGIRLSTRPDFINAEILKFLKQYNVTSIELGVQSMSDTVLNASKRGHTSRSTINSSEMILENGFSLIHQMMVGLPESTFSDEYKTAEFSVKIGAKEVRIYPVIVIKNTELEELWSTGQYTPLDENEAINRCARLVAYFESNNINVIKCGLHPSEGLLNGTEYLAGPFHPAFRQKVDSHIYGIFFKTFLRKHKIEILSFNPSDEPNIYGFNSTNKTLFKNINMNKNISIPIGSITIHYNGKNLKFSKKQIIEKTLKEM
jgi:histone acetyltransferase (RNA polymerase elongator complex component)